MKYLLIYIKSKICIYALLEVSKLYAFNEFKINFFLTLDDLINFTFLFNK